MNNMFFTKYDVRGDAESGEMLEVVWNLGKALADWLPTAGSVLVFADTTAKERLVSAVIEGLILQGRDVQYTTSSTPENMENRITSVGASGAVRFGLDAVSQIATVSLYQHEGHLIDTASGLAHIAELVEAGNFVPAAQKGSVTQI